jgi:NTE family protein
MKNNFQGNVTQRTGQYESLVGLLRPILTRLFGQMPKEDWDKLSSYLEEVDLPGGYYLFRKGDRGDAMYILLNGRLQVQIEEGQNIRVINEVGRGEVVGEMALITGENRSASIFAIRDCHLVRISKEGFYKFFTLFPAIGLNLAKLLIERLTQKQASRRLRAISNIAIMALHKSIEMEAIVGQLQRTFSKSGKKVRLLSSEVVDAALGEKAAQTSLNQFEENKKLSAWLDKEERLNDLVFYLPDEENTEWTKRCVRQADEILLVADASMSPAVARLERQVLSGENKLSAARQTLVLVQPEGVNAPHGTAQWLKTRQVGFFTHIRRDHVKRDCERLARYLTDNMTGLVLAGGGAKGFAHIGVWKALQEAGTPVDFIGGTSMGAMLGGLMAYDWDYERVYAVCREIAFSPLKSDFNILPVVSLFKGKVLDRVLQKYYLECDIEDCPIPFYCVSSNLTRAHPTIHRRGNMFKAIRASGAIPAVVPPVVDQNSLLIDGGVFNNFPTDVMVDMGARFIIGVDFFVDQNQSIEFNEMPSNWKVLRKRWFGNANQHNMPTLINTIIQSTTLYSDYQQKQNIEKTDIYINPNVNQYNMLDWRAYDKIVKKGYEEAVRVLQESQDKISAFEHAQ